MTSQKVAPPFVVYYQGSKPELLDELLKDNAFKLANQAALTSTSGDWLDLVNLAVTDSVRNYPGSHRLILFSDVEFKKNLGADKESKEDLTKNLVELLKQFPIVGMPEILKLGHQGKEDCTLLSKAKQIPGTRYSAYTSNTSKAVPSAVLVPAHVSRLSKDSEAMTINPWVLSKKSQFGVSVVECLEPEPCAPCESKQNLFERLQGAVIRKGEASRSVRAINSSNWFGRILLAAIFIFVFYFLFRSGYITHQIFVGLTVVLLLFVLLL